MICDVLRKIADVMDENEFGMRRTCPECPWLLSSAPGKFPPERYIDLADTCKPGGIPRALFACHMTPEENTRACAGMMIVCGDDAPNMLRLLWARRLIDPSNVEASGPLYPSYRAMAAANGCDPNDPAFEGLPA
jgi:hypothetical protein